MQPSTVEAIQGKEICLYASNIITKKTVLQLITLMNIMHKNFKTSEQ